MLHGCPEGLPRDGVPELGGSVSLPVRMVLPSGLSAATISVFPPIAAPRGCPVAVSQSRARSAGGFEHPTLSVWFCHPGRRTPTRRHFHEPGASRKETRCWRPRTGDLVAARCGDDLTVGAECHGSDPAFMFCREPSLRAVRLGRGLAVMGHPRAGRLYHSSRSESSYRPG